jgi:hypothetical protein
VKHPNIETKCSQKMEIRRSPNTIATIPPANDPSIIEITIGRAGTGGSVLQKMPKSRTPHIRPATPPLIALSKMPAIAITS